jgi:hypothetical protein
MLPANEFALTQPVPAGEVRIISAFRSQPAF